MKLYHRTDRKNISSIFKHGFKKSDGAFGRGAYFSIKPLSIMYGDKVITVEVILKGKKYYQIRTNKDTIELKEKVKKH